MSACPRLGPCAHTLVRLTPRWPSRRAVDKAAAYRRRSNLGRVASCARGYCAGQRHTQGFELIPSGGTRLGTPVDLLGRYSKRTSWTKRVHGLGNLPEGNRSPLKSHRRAVVARLSPAQVTALVEAYRSGASVYGLAARFGIHRATVSAHLHRHGVTMRRRGLDEQGVDHVVRLYEQGWSVARIGARLGIDGGTAWVCAPSARSAHP